MMNILKTIPFLGICLFIQYSYVQPTAASETKGAEMVDAYELIRDEIDDYYERKGFISGVNKKKNGTFLITDGISPGSTIEAFCFAVAEISKLIKTETVTKEGENESGVIETYSKIVLASKYRIGTHSSMTQSGILSEYDDEFGKYSEVISINSPNVSINCKYSEGPPDAEGFFLSYEVELLGKESVAHDGGSFSDVLDDFRNEGFGMKWFWHPTGQAVGLTLACCRKNVAH